MDIQRTRPEVNSESKFHSKKKKKKKKKKKIHKENNLVGKVSLVKLEHFHLPTCRSNSAST